MTHHEALSLAAAALSDVARHWPHSADADRQRYAPIAREARDLILDLRDRFGVPPGQHGSSVLSVPPPSAPSV